MKFTKYLAFMLLVSGLCNISYALDVGDRAPELNVSEWVRGKPVVLFPKNNEKYDIATINAAVLDLPFFRGLPVKAKTLEKKRNTSYIYVIFFWATWTNSSLRLLDFVEKEKNLYSNEDIVFLGISKENASRVKNYLEPKNNINISLGIDNKAETYDKYMQGTKGVPVFFIIGRNGELIWKGSPLEVDRVLSRVVAGTFDAEGQGKIEELRESIKNSSHIFDNNSKKKAAIKTLNIDPTDETAINIVVDNYIRKNQIVKAIEFVENARKKAGENKYLQRNLFYIELGIIRGMDVNKSKDILNNLTKSFYATFYDNSVFLNEFAVMILKNAPFEVRPLKELLKMAERAVFLESKRNAISENLGMYLQTLARVYYCLGWFTKAITTQSQAIPLLKDKKERKTALLKQKYYIEVFKINQYSR